MLAAIAGSVPRPTIAWTAHATALALAKNNPVISPEKIFIYF
jgi:hypothetical protein